jgi:uncharacterized protein (TIGR04222 family)
MCLLAATDVLNLAGPDFLEFFAVAVALAALAGCILRWFSRMPFDALSGSEDEVKDPYEIAYLAGGAQRAVDTAISSLFIAGALMPGSTGRKFHASGSNKPVAFPIERAMLDAAGPAPGLTRPELQRAVANQLSEIAQPLRQRGLIPAMGGLHIRLLTALPLLLICLLGAAKVLVGIDRQRPVAILVVLVVLTLIGAVAAAVVPVYRTVRGQRVHRSIRASHAALRQAAFGGKEPIGPDQAPLAVAMFGVGALATTPYAALTTLIAPPRSIGDAGSSSCSSSGCGGGGCGGGGCGGCS